MTGIKSSGIKLEPKPMPEYVDSRLITGSFASGILFGWIVVGIIYIVWLVFHG